MPWVNLVLTPGFLVGRGIEIAGIGKSWQDELILLLLLACSLLIVSGLMAESIKKLFE